MREIKKVLWKEGMFLQPQHFQQFERFLLGSMQMRLTSLSPHYYGVTEYVLNADAIANGTVSIIKMKGIMPDGTPFRIPEYDSSPPARPFADHFSHEQQTLIVYLGLPLTTLGKPNVYDGVELSGDVRYRSAPVSISDEVSGRQKKEIEIGEHSLVILFEDDSRDNFTTIPIARLVRNSTGQMNIDPAFFPPLLQIGASVHLINQLRLLLELFHAKITSLSQGRKHLKSGFAEFGTSDQTSMHLLEILNTHTPLLNYYHSNPAVHPYDLYHLLMQCTGALCSYSADITIHSLPLYEHINFSLSFSIFDSLIRRILGTDIAAACIPIPIENIGPSTFLCKIADQSYFTSGSFYIGLSADVSERELVVGTLSRIKMSSREKLDLIIPSAMPGLPLTYENKPPERMSSKPGFVYFKLSSHGEFWEGIKLSGTIAFYYPHHYKNFSMEMLFVRH